MTQRRQSNNRKAGPEVGRKAEQRPARIPIDGLERNLLTVSGKDPDYYYRWVQDTEDNGTRLQRFLMAYYEFAKRSEVDSIGEASVYKSESHGSIVKVPADKQGNWLYLMKIRMEYRLEDEARKQRRVDGTMETAHSPSKEKGQYAPDGYETVKQTVDIR